MGDIGFPEILIIAVVIMVLFGAKKIPELMRGLGKGVKEFNDGKNGLLKDLDTKTNTTPSNTNQSSSITDVDHEAVK